MLAFPGEPSVSGCMCTVGLARCTLSALLDWPGEPLVSGYVLLDWPGVPSVHCWTGRPGEPSVSGYVGLAS